MEPKMRYKIVLPLFLSLATTLAISCASSSYADERVESDNGNLKFRVFTSEDDGFLVNSVIVEGISEILLVDAQLSRANALRVLNIIRETGKKLSAIYITHEHPDHFLGLEVFKDAFPDVRILANSKVVDRINKIYPAKLRKWKELIGEKASSRQVPITKFDGDCLLVGSSRVEIHKHLQGDTDENSFLWFPKERVAITGDIVFDQAHLYTTETTPQERKNWIATLNSIEGLNPITVIPGHSQPGKVFDTRSSVEYTKNYLSVFEEELAKSKSAYELVGRMKEKFPQAGVLFSLKRSAEKIFTTSDPKRLDEIN